MNASIEVCFDLSRSIDLHVISTAATNEKAIDGVTTGLIGLNEFVTWQAKHFGFTQKLTTKITAYNRPFHFRDEQVKGAFRKIKHDHFFTEKDNYVLMIDEFLFESPFGMLGHLFNRIILTMYMRKLLIERNNTIKQFAESGKWKRLLLSKA